MVGAQQSQSVQDALLEDLVGESPVGQGTGHLERPDHQGEDAERPARVLTRGSSGARRAAMSSITRQQTVGVGALHGVR